MFSVSTQKKFWTYGDEHDLYHLREKHNLAFIAKHGAHIDDFQKYAYFLSPDEEKILLRQYELHLREFCKRFSPPMPKGVIGTAFHYFKRFYLNNSPMDYHPKEILATCVYLSCKVEEFNVSIEQFVANIKGDREKASDIILNNELLLMRQVNYHLTVHNPFRPIEGFLIDIKTRCGLANPERLRHGIDEFLDKAFFTDSCLLYAPSQIALAAVLHAASKEQENLDSYVTDTLFRDAGQEKLAILIEAVRKIRSMVKLVENPPKDKVKSLERKLDRCRNQENNPDSEIYKRRLREALDEDDGPSVTRMAMDHGIVQMLSPSAL